MEVLLCSKVACGARHSCVVTQEGEMWCWGWSLHGQCASGLPSLPLPEVVKGMQGLKVVGVAAGLAHTLAASDAGDAYRFARFGHLLCNSCPAHG